MRLPARRIAAAALAIACVTCSAGARADDAELRTLKQQVDELKNTVRQLQERINALEQSDATTWVPATTAPESSTSPPPAPEISTSVAPATVAPAPVNAVPVPESPRPTAKASVNDKVVMLRTSWQRISQGMTQSDVTQTLGPPTRQMLINSKVVWYYYYAGIGAGSVFFNGDGRISSSQSPNLGWAF
ncbi:MAG: outer membrane protein assembly factor BamE [Betaproteobacteria bacterium]|jgi:hypothetical protein